MGKQRKRAGSKAKKQRSLKKGVSSKDCEDSREEQGSRLATEEPSTEIDNGEARGDKSSDPDTIRKPDSFNGEEEHLSAGKIDGGSIGSGNAESEKNDKSVEGSEVVLKPDLGSDSGETHEARGLEAGEESGSGVSAKNLDLKRDLESSLPKPSEELETPDESENPPEEAIKTNMDSGDRLDSIDIGLVLESGPDHGAGVRIVEPEKLKSSEESKPGKVIGGAANSESGEESEKPLESAEDFEKEIKNTVVGSEEKAKKVEKTEKEDDKGGYENVTDKTLEKEAESPENEAESPENEAKSPENEAESFENEGEPSQIELKKEPGESPEMVDQKESPIKSESDKITEKEPQNRGKRELSQGQNMPISTVQSSVSIADETARSDEEKNTEEVFSKDPSYQNGTENPHHPRTTTKIEAETSIEPPQIIPSQDQPEAPKTEANSSPESEPIEKPRESTIETIPSHSPTRNQKNEPFNGPLKNNLETYAESGNQQFDKDDIQKNNEDETRVQPPKQKSEPPKAISTPLFTIDPLVVPQTPLFPSSSPPHITCIEAYDDNIYMGTSTGEILHFFELEGQYTLISRQKAHATKTKPIKKILLLPFVSKALVLNGSMVNVFSLPELLPANIGKIRDVSDMVINQSESSAGASVTLFTKKIIRTILVTDSALKLVKDISYPDSVKGLTHGDLAMVATLLHYDLIDTVSFARIPLLEVGKYPLIQSVSESEFLVACGADDNAVGMVVNHKGDVSRGTISWSSYPSSLAVEYPYVLALHHSYSLSISSLATQQQVDLAEFPSEMEIQRVSKTYIRESDPGLESLLDIIDLSNGSERPLDKKIPGLASTQSNTLAYQPSSGYVYLILPKSMLLRLEKMVLWSLPDLQKTYEDECKLFRGTSEHLAVFQFVSQLLGLALIRARNFPLALKFWTNRYTDTLDSGFFSSEVYRKCQIGGKNGDILTDLASRPDPRIIIYLLGIKTSGTFVYRGLKDYIISKVLPVNSRSFCVKVLLDWLDKLNELGSSKKEKALLGVQKVRSVRSSSFNTLKTVKEALSREANSDTDLKKMALKHKQSEESKESKPLKRSDQIDQSIPSEIIALFKEIELALLELYIQELEKTGSDKALLLFVENHLKLTFDEGVKLLESRGKYAIVLLMLEGSRKKEYFQLWKKLMDGSLRDQSFPLEQLFKESQVDSMNVKVFEERQYDLFDYMDFLVRIGFTNTVLEQLPKEDIENVLSFLGKSAISDSDVKKYTKSRANCRFSSIEEYRISLFVDRSQYAGSMGLEIAEYLAKLAANHHDMVASFMSQVYEEYYNLEEFPKPPFHGFLKTRVKMAKKGDRLVLAKLFDYGTRLWVLERQIGEKVFFGKESKNRNDFLQSVLRILERTGSDVFLLDRIRIYGCLKDWHTTIQRLGTLGDFATLESYVFSGGRVLYGKDIFEKQLDETGATFHHLFDSHSCLLNIYNFYIGKHLQNRKLIHHFLDQYGTLLPLNDILAGIPDLFSIKEMASFVKQELDKSEEEVNASLVKKNLARSELEFQTKLYRLLKN